MKKILRLYLRFEGAQDAFWTFRDFPAERQKSCWRVTAEDRSISIEFAVIPTKQSIERFMGRDFQEIQVYGPINPEVLELLKLILRAPVIIYDPHR